MAVEWLRWRMGEVERAGAGNGDGGAPELRWLLRLRARTKVEPKKRKMGCGMDRAGAGGDNGWLWPVLAALDRALRCAAIAATTRCASSASVGH